MSLVKMVWGWGFSKQLSKAATTSSDFYILPFSKHGHVHDVYEIRHPHLCLCTMTPAQFLSFSQISLIENWSFSNQWPLLPSLWLLPLCSNPGLTLPPQLFSSPSPCCWANGFSFSSVPTHFCSKHESYDIHNCTENSTLLLYFSVFIWLKFNC